MTTPRTSEPAIRIVPLDEADAAIWRLTREVAAILRGLPWVLIDGQMVRVIEAEHGVTLPIGTADVDALLDVRMMSTATEEAATRLQAADFKPQRHSGGLTYRFIRGDDIVRGDCRHRRWAIRSRQRAAGRARARWQARWEARWQARWEARWQARAVHSLGACQRVYAALSEQFDSQE